MRYGQSIIQLDRCCDSVHLANGNKAIEIAATIIFAFKIMKDRFPIVLRIYPEFFNIPTRFTGNNQFG